MGNSDALKEGMPVGSALGINSCCVDGIEEGIPDGYPLSFALILVGYPVGYPDLILNTEIAAKLA